MAPLFISSGNLLQLTVIHEPEAHLNGQTVLKQTYNPDYYGFLTHQKPGSVFTYTSEGKKRLSENELAQVIEQIPA